MLKRAPLGSPRRTRRDHDQDEFDWLFGARTLTDGADTDDAEVELGPRRFRNPFHASVYDLAARALRDSADHDLLRHRFETTARRLRTVHADAIGSPLEGRICLLLPLGTLEVAGVRALVIGRSAACDLVLDDPGIASRHARLLVLDHTVVIERGEPGSTLRVNGADVMKNSRLCAGDHVVLGTTELQVFPAESSPSSGKRARNG